MKSDVIHCAVYARRSNDESDRNEENKSVTRQIERARAYAHAKGWHAANEHIYVDDGVSGAEFVDRPAFLRLIASLPKRGKPPFDVLVMSEPSRLGRDMTRNAAFVLNIIESGVRIFYYLTDEEELADTPEQRVMLTLKSYASEVERLKAAQRSRDALERKAAQGYNAGGIVFGYDNVPVHGIAVNGERVKTHTDYCVNKEQADVLRRMFTMSGAGYGHVSIARTMNGDPQYEQLSRKYFNGIRPASPRKGTGSWAPSSVYAMLRNERYTGTVPFGEFRKTYRRGTRARVRRDEKDIMRTSRPDLRIIPDELWRAVQDRLASSRKTYLKDTNGRLWGRPGRGTESKYLLTGLASCGCCEHNVTKIGGRVGSFGKRGIRHYYGCSYHATRGRTICANDLLAPMEATNKLVLDRIRGVMTPQVVGRTVDRALALLAQEQRMNADVPARLEAEARKLRREIDRFLHAIAGGSAPASVVAEIRRRETRLAEIELERAALLILQPSELETRRLKKALCERLGQFDELLLGDVPAAREALRKLIAGRITFEPVERDGERAYHLRWTLVTDALLDGNILKASPRLRRRIPPLRAIKNLSFAA